MEDTSGMTIEFLRAGLLSERSVLRTASQRADELAKRVVGLEEQLKSVSILRNKVEQATVDVLSILENHGINEFPEQFDSSSDREMTCCESKLESSPLPGRSLSWKSGKDSPHSYETKYVDSSTRRRSTFASGTSASLKLRVGEVTQVNSNILPREDNGVDTCSEGSHTLSDTGHEILRGRSGGMKRRKKAQREWEEKFKEDNNSTPFLGCDGRRDDTTTHAPPYPVATVTQDQDRNLKASCVTKESPKMQPDGLQFSQHVDLGGLQNQKSSGMLASVFPVATGKQDPQHSRNFNVLPSHNYHHRSCSEGPAANQSALVILSHEGTTLYGGGSIVKAIEYSVGDKPEVPVGCAGPFGVPSDFHIKATNKSNVLGSSSLVSLTNYYPDAASALTACDRFITSPCTETRSSASTGDRHRTIPTSLHTESRSKNPIWEPMAPRSRFSSPVPFFEPSLDMGLPYSSRTTYSDPKFQIGIQVYPLQLCTLLLLILFLRT
ncbi:hypothetical protein Acr_00g0083110 [Actinidia rufa]|uniref:Uncharacterized protein n=1 Tax=Actinidia rufa TaxID=165716 RepID=A0A7J0DW22_9ERIC|nr:hypothetical protein Acr_00g0083110 [Actinidia rufa]